MVTRARRVTHALPQGRGGAGPGLLVEVAYARPDRQIILSVELPHGATAAEAVVLSRIAEQFPEIDEKHAELGIFGKRVKRDHVLRAGDRVEIYRPLQADPKDVRRELAALAKRGGRAPASKESD